jgi:hypothetical protein
MAKNISVTTKTMSDYENPNLLASEREALWRLNTHPDAESSPTGKCEATPAIPESNPKQFE